MKRKVPSVLTIAGSDCSGGAGIQADIKTISALGCYAASAITAITVQNTCGVKNIMPLPAHVIKAQVETVIEDMDVNVIKIGMLTDRETILALTAVLNRHPEIRIVLDPVMASSNGVPFITEQALEAMKQALLPLCTLITPNLPETEILTGYTPHTVDEMTTAGREMLRFGCKAVLVKGGHLPSSGKTDVLVANGADEAIHTFLSAEIKTCNTHGTGCTLSSAIAAYMARGLPLAKAVDKAKTYVTHALESASEIHFGHGHGPLNHFFDPQKLIIN